MFHVSSEEDPSAAAETGRPAGYWVARKIKSLAIAVIAGRLKIPLRQRYRKQDADPLPLAGM